MSERAKQFDILLELSKHGHPKCRIMPNGKQRVTNQAAKELLEHYQHYHYDQI